MRVGRYIGPLAAGPIKAAVLVPTPAITPGLVTSSIYTPGTSRIGMNYSLLYELDIVVSGRGRHVQGSGRFSESLGTCAQYERARLQAAEDVAALIVGSGDSERCSA